MALKNYLKAARLRTLPLSVSGIIVGCFAADFINILAFSSQKNYTIFVLAILTTIGFQIISNFANDYGDGIKGSDKNRVGEARMVASGAITPKQMKNAIVFTSIVTICIALVLIYLAFGSENFSYSAIFFILGLLSILAAIKYTVGNSAYGYSGFGDVFVFLFFGLLSTLGSNFLYTKQIDVLLFLPAISIGLLSVAVLNLNNLRDWKEDKKNNKNTIVVKLGFDKAKIYHLSLIAIAFGTALIFTLLNYKNITRFIFGIAFVPLVLNCIKLMQTTNEKDLDSELKKVALSTFLFALLFAIFNV